MPSSAQETAPADTRTLDPSERIQTMRRLFTVGVIAWPLFFIADLIPLIAVGDTTHLDWLVLLRAVGECAALACYLPMRSQRLSDRVLTAMDWGVFVTGSSLLALMGIPFGGISSRFHQGVAIFIIARCALLPLPWWRALRLPIGVTLAYPITLGVASAFVPEMRAQWSSRFDLGIFLYNFVFCASGAGVGILASHLLWDARREAKQASRLGNYRLKARIGSGGVGEVWLARQLTLGRDVALKVLREQSQRSRETIQRFQREARAASQLKHRNTIRIHDFGASEDGLLFIAMELLDGMDLDALVTTNGPIRPARAIYLALQACGSLAEAHARGIIHRDIKPANIFVSRAGGEYDVVKILDFGMAHVDEPIDTSLTGTGSLTGTPAFMSPEICSGDPNIDARADIYSFGAVLYFMLTGSLIFPNKSFVEVVKMHVTKMPEPPSARIGAAMPEDLERVVMKCLAKKPADRYASIDAMAADLEACEDAHGWSGEMAERWWGTGPASAHFRVSA
jgi:serine/threonine-protein kinase